MNRKLLAGLAAAGILAGGGGAAALVAAGAPATAGTAATVSSTVTVPGYYGPLGSLVAQGTISRSEAAAIHNGLMTYMHSHWQQMRGECGSGATPWMLEKGGPLATVLGQLVSDGTLTRSQATAVTSAFTQWMQAHHGYGPGYHRTGQDRDGWGMMGGYGGGMMR